MLSQRIALLIFKIQATPQNNIDTFKKLQKASKSFKKLQKASKS